MSKVVASCFSLPFQVHAMISKTVVGNNPYIAYSTILTTFKLKNLDNSRAVNGICTTLTFRSLFQLFKCRC